MEDNMQSIQANGSSVLPSLLLCATVITATAGNAVLTPVSDRYAEDANVDGAFETLFAESTTRLYADSNYFVAGVRAAAMEFDLSSLPTNAVVQSAELSIQAAAFTLSNSQRVSGYPGNGAVELADMTGGTILGTFTVPVSPQIGKLEVGPYVQALLQSAQTYAGLRVESAGCGIYSSCGVSFHASGTVQAPTLNLQFAVPPRITELVRTNAVDLGISLETYGGQTYFVERCLTIGAWSVMQTNIVGTGSIVRVTDPGAQSLGEVYYRVGVHQ